GADPAAGAVGRPAGAGAGAQGAARRGGRGGARVRGGAGPGSAGRLRRGARGTAHRRRAVGRRLPPTTQFRQNRAQRAPGARRLGETARRTVAGPVGRHTAHGCRAGGDWGRGMPTPQTPYDAGVHAARDVTAVGAALEAEMLGGALLGGVYAVAAADGDRARAVRDFVGRFLTHTARRRTGAARAIRSVFAALSPDAPGAGAVRPGARS